MRYFLTGNASKYLENVQIKKMLLASVLRLEAAQKVLYVWQDLGGGLNSSKVGPGFWLLCKIHAE